MFTLSLIMIIVTKEFLSVRLYMYVYGGGIKIFLCHDKNSKL